MFPRSPLLAIVLSLLILGSALGVTIAQWGIPYMDFGGDIGDESDGDDRTLVDPEPPISSHLMTESDMEELKAVMGVYRGNTSDAVLATGLRPPTEDEWEAMVGNMTILDYVTPTTLTSSTSLDLSQSIYFPKIGNQGSLGSCAAWAEVYYSLGYLTAKAHGWTGPSLGYQQQLLSPLWTYDLQNGGYDRGSYMGGNTAVATTIGVATMATMPYQTIATVWGGEEAWREAAAYQARSFSFIGYNSDTEISTIKSLLSSGTPVVFSIYANNFSSIHADATGNRNNIISSSEYSASYTNHAQTIVGYFDDMSDNGETGVFKVANSWGTGFGVSGYYYVTYQAFLEIASCGGEVGYVTLEDEEASALAVWHFDLAPGRDATISVSAVRTSTGSTLSRVEPYIDAYTSGYATIYPMSHFMCLDISALSDHLGVSTIDIVLSIGDTVIVYQSGDSPEISSFRVEEYLHGYEPGKASTISDQAEGLPAITPCSIALDQRSLLEFPTTDALDWDYEALSFVGTAQWVGVDTGNDSISSLQSGDVGDLSASMFIAFVVGPGTLSFDWRVSSEDGYDFLRFYVDGELVSEICGQQAWARAEHPLSSGLHNVTWSYEKDDYVSCGDDCCWIDNVGWTGFAVMEYIGFEDGLSGLVPSDINSASGIDTWGVLCNRVGSGSCSAWCSAQGNGTNGSPNYLNGYYDINMDALLVMTLPDLTACGVTQLSFYYWAVTGSSALSDRLYIETFSLNDGWTEVWTQPSISSGGWTNVQFFLSDDMTMVRFCFHSDNSAGAYEGVYLDDILLTASDANAPTSSVNALSEYTTSNVLSLDCEVDDGAMAWEGTLQIFYCVGSSINYDLYTTLSNPSGKWSGTAIEFIFDEVGGVEGLYRFYSVATDRAGNMEPAPLSHDAITIYDPASPTTAASTDGVPAPLWNDHAVAVTLMASDDTSGISSILYQLNDRPWSEYTSAFSITTEGCHTVQYYSVDAAGNIGNVGSLSVNIDLSDPILTITSPTAGSYSRSSTISWTTSDVSGIEMTEISIDGISWSTVYGTSTTLDLDDGANVIHVRVMDKVGQETTASVSFFIDTSGPSLTMTSPSEGSFLSNGSVTISWAASDALSGIAHYQVSIDGCTWMTTFTKYFTFSGLQDGEWVAYVRAYDAVGNIKEASVSFTVDTIAPTMINSPTGNGVDVDASVMVEFSEAMDKSTVLIIINGIETAISWNGNDAIASPTFLESNGIYAVTVKGQDLVGNEVEGSWTFHTVETGYISGTLIDENGDALTFVTVALSNGWTTTTDASGDFSFENVTSGSYSITVVEDGYETRTLDVDVAGGEDGNIGVATVYNVSNLTSGDMTQLVALMALMASLTAVCGVALKKRRK